MSILGSDFLRQKHKSFLVFGVELASTTTGDARITDAQAKIAAKFIKLPLRCVFDGTISTNAHNQTILDVAVPVSQIGIDARILL
ncbi:hypothetical protein EfmJHP10_24630 [Enterococcus faecium]|nr:hypothetical protein EfmJHP10_24630 [Enterococcus faecium]